MTDDRFDETIPTRANRDTPEDQHAKQPEDASLATTQPIVTQIPVEDIPLASSEYSPPEDPGEPANISGAKGKGIRWGLIPLIGILVLLAVGGIAATAGYRAGIGVRLEAEATSVAQQAEEQFNLGVEDMSMGLFERARQRFEYVIRMDPGYPGAAEKLAEVLLEINTTATPTLLPTPTITPTPDARGVEGMFDTASQQLANSEWETAIETLLRVRKEDPAYRPVDIDGMLFLALRSRGMDKIAKQADLEGGLYDLALAARFGPLDNEAQGFLNWATLYLTGASFWDLDWRQVVFYFEQLASALPYLTDGSGMSAAERYRLGLIGLGNTLLREGAACQAAEKFELALSFGADTKAEEGLIEARKECDGGGSDQTQVAPTSNASPPPVPTVGPPPPPVATTEPPPPPVVTTEPPPPPPSDTPPPTTGP